MTDNNDQLPLQALNEALGDEIRRARRGRTRADVVADWPGELSVQSLANWEYGIRSMNVNRFVMLCELLHVSAPELLGLALQRLGLALRTNEVYVDLDKLLATTDKSMELLRQWARNHPASRPDRQPVVSVSPSVVEHFAILMGLSWAELMTLLLPLTPDAAALLSGPQVSATAS